MSTFRVVEFWPSTGWPDGPWCRDPGEDAFVKSARSVCELYGEGLRLLRLAAPLSTLRLSCALDQHPVDGEVLVEVFTDRAMGFELARVSLPTGLAALAPEARAAVVLEVVHGATVRLGAARGWDGAVLQAAHRHVLDQGLRFVWAGPWKSSPDRRHRARPVYRLEDDGFGRVALHVQRRSDGVTVAVSGEGLAFSTSEGFVRSARTLRWAGNAAVQVVPFCGLGGEQQGLLRLDLPFPAAGTEPALAPVTEVEGAAAGSAVRRAPQAFRVVVQARGTDAAESTPEIMVLGTGPMYGLARVYGKALDTLLERLDSRPWHPEAPAWLAWWSAADVDLLEVMFSEEATEPKVRTRRADNKLAVWIYRPIETIADAPDQALLARQDVVDMLAAVRRRTGLGPHPDLPSAADLGALATRSILREDESTRRLRALLASLSDRLPPWLHKGLVEEVDDGAEGDVIDALLVQIPRLAIELTEHEAAELAFQQQPLDP